MALSFGKRMIAMVGRHTRLTVLSVFLVMRDNLQSSEGKVTSLSSAKRVGRQV